MSAIIANVLLLRFKLRDQDRSLPLSGERIRIGRELDNDIVLPDPSVSRHHAELFRDGNRWKVRDQRSTNGVQLNRMPIEEAPLQAGDRLTVGAFELIVEASQPEPPEPPPGSTIKSRLPDATILRPLKDFLADYDLGREGRPPSPTDGDAKSARVMFGSLARLARLLLRAEDVDEVLDRVLAIAFEALPVDRGFILLSGQEGQLVCELARFGERLEVRPSGDVPVSRTMLEEVMRERVALVTYDALADGRLVGGESIRMHQIRAAMCAPLWSGERIVGVIQVDSPFQVGTFGERDLDFLTTLANFAAVAVESARNAARAAQEREFRSRLERYHSPAVIDEILREESQGRPVRAAEATVLFADLVGFTAFSEGSPPTEVARLLDTFLDLAVDAVFAAGGTLDKFIGDCVMAFFGAPVPQADHALRAVQAAIDIQKRVTAWNSERESEGLPTLAVRVGVNSGPVVVGDIGSRRRVDYTVLGNTVNIAARLESSVAQPGDVVMGPETHRLIEGAVPAISLGELRLKGLKQAVEAWKVRVG